MTHCPDSLLLEHRPYQTYQKRSHLRGAPKTKMA